MFNIGDRSSKYVKVWEVTPQEKYTKVKISTSRKDQNDSYVNSNWFANLVGEAHKKAGQLEKGTTIEITSGGVEQVYVKEKEKTYINVTIFNFEVLDGAKSTSNSDGFVPMATDEDDDDLPF